MSRLVAAITRTSTFWLRSEPSGSNSRSCSTRSSFACSAVAIVPISSRKIVPPSASANLPFLLVSAPVKAPRTWPNSSDSSRFSGIAAQFTLTSGIVALRAVEVNRARDHLLAGAGLAGDEHRALRFRHHLRRADHVLHAAAAPDDAVLVELLVALAEQVAVLGPQALVIEGAVDHDQQLVDLERLLEVVERAELHRLDRALDGGVRGHHQDLRPLAGRGRRDQLADQIEPVRSGIRLSTRSTSNDAAGEQPLRLARVARRHDLVPFFAQRLGQRVADLGLVVDEQNGAGGLGHAVGASRGSSMRTSVPRSRSLATVMRPPSPSMMFREIARPMPVPVRRVVKYGSKSRGRSSGAMPVPLSRHRDGRRGGRPPAAVRREWPGRRPVRARVATAWMALPRMLTRACRSRSASVSPLGCRVEVEADPRVQPVGRFGRARGVPASARSDPPGPDRT